MNLKYRHYKNGLYGIKLKNFYIAPQDENNIAVLDDMFYILKDGFESKEDAAWYIIKRVASEEEMKVLKVLYSKELGELTKIMLEYYGRKELQAKYIFDMASLIRDRKDDGKEW